jgi:aspartyl protease family protein
MLLPISPVAAVEQVLVLGLFKDKVLLRVGSKQHLLRVGETSPEGLKLLAADSQGAVVEYRGQRQRHGLSEQVGTRFARPAAAELVLWPNHRGMYSTSGSINGLPVEFLVDTGADVVALSQVEAEHLGLDLHTGHQPVRVRTASGQALGYPVRLSEVKAGAIVVNDVEAVVVEGSEPAQVLLGMSFLRRLQLDHDGSRLILKQQR